MNIQALAETCQWDVVLAPAQDLPVTSAYTSDLLSDVMARAHDADLLITIQAHNNTVAVASLAGLQAIVVCNQRPIPDDMLASARNEGIGIYRTAQNQFETSCRVGALL